MKAINSFRVDQLKVKVFRNNNEMGAAAAEFVAKVLQEVLNQKNEANIIIATGASQFSFYNALKVKKLIDWNKITIFHLDEYAGMSDRHPASFRKYLKERILKYIDPKGIHLLNGNATDIEKEIKRYESLLKNVEIDLACIGIGENGHIAFNDPPVADFNDPHLVKLVELDMDCRKQQLGEGWFKTLEEVPTHALSLTIPAIMRAKIISCVVPDKRKAESVSKTIHGPISTMCPASILRSHNNCILFLDTHSADLV